MANTKITELTQLTNPVSTDVLPIVDVGADVTKKISIADLLKNASAGTAAAPGIAFDGDSNTGIYSPGADQLAISTNGTGRLFVDASGRLGIDTISPSTIFRATVNGDGSSVVGGFSLRNNGTEYLTIGSAAANDAANVDIWGVANGYMRFATNNTERLRITSDGKLGLGTSNPQARLEISGSPSAGVPALDLSPYSANVSDTSDVVLSSNGVIRAAASIRNVVNSSGIYQWYIGGSDIKAGISGASEVMRIDSSGRLLVGTSTADTWFGSRLQIQDAGSEASAYIIRNQDTANGATLFLGKSRGTTAGSATIVQANDNLGSIDFLGADGTDVRTLGARITAQVDGTPGADDLPTRLVFSTCSSGSASPTERMRINSSGAQQAYSANDVYRAASGQAAGTSFGFYYGYHSATTTQNGTLAYLVYTNGNVVNANNSYGAISDIKLKENIVDATSQWDDLKALQIRKYNFKEGQTHTQIGLIAQEVELVSPGLVSESPDRDEDGNDLGTVTKSVNYSVLYMKAVKALQEAMERIETLEAKVAALEAS